MSEELISINIDDRRLTVARKDYIKAKTAQLREFGYRDLTVEDVDSQLSKLLAGEKLSVIGMFMQKEVEIPEHSA